MLFFFQMVEMTVTVTTAMAKSEKLDLFPKTSQHVRCLSCFASTRDLLNIDNNLLNEVEDDINCCYMQNYYTRFLT